MFDSVDDPRPARVLAFDPRRNRTFYYWHMFVPGLTAGQLYAYRVHGPTVPEYGLRYDGAKALLDPYGRAVAYGARYSRAAAARPGDNAATAMKSVVTDPRAYNWEGDKPLQVPYAERLSTSCTSAGLRGTPTPAWPPSGAARTPG